MPRKKLTEEEEIARVKAMYEYEHNCRDNGYTVVAGVDEAGRGPLAGPVYAAAVILPNDIIIKGINDSKKLSEKKREELFEEITEKAIAYKYFKRNVRGNERCGKRTKHCTQFCAYRR